MNVLQKVIRRARAMYLSMLDDTSYAKLKYRWKFGRELHLDNPEYFSEKLQWLKLNDDNEGHFIYADKYGVRAIVAERIGSQYLNELYFVTDDPDSIDFAKLPNSFVLKATHGSGYNLICADKKTFDAEKAKIKLRRWLSTNYALKSREKQYNAIPRRIICEKYLVDDSGSLRDYKILCFNGEPKLVWIDVDRQNCHRRAFYTPCWETVPVTFSKYPLYPDHIPRPDNLEEMIRFARILSNGFPFARVDFYSVEGKTIFGEITFHPASGFAEFTPLEYSLEVGSWIPTVRESGQPCTR